MLVRKRATNSCYPLLPKSTDWKLDPGLLHPGNKGQSPGRDTLLPTWSSASSSQSSLNLGSGCHRDHRPSYPGLYLLPQGVWDLPAKEQRSAIQWEPRIWEMRSIWRDLNCPNAFYPSLLELGNLEPQKLFLQASRGLASCYAPSSSLNSITKSKGDAQSGEWWTKAGR